MMNKCFMKNWAGSSRAGFDWLISVGHVSFAGESGAEATALQTLRVCEAAAKCGFVG